MKNLAQRPTTGIPEHLVPEFRRPSAAGLAERCSAEEGTLPATRPTTPRPCLLRAVPAPWMIATERLHTGTRC